MDLRIGHGIDIHPLVPGRPCVLGGVTIPCDRGLAGHSDADAIVHALMDAILGALGERDIGHLFPDSDPSLAGADSCKLLAIVWKKAASEGWQLVNADISMLAQVPRLAPHIEDMRRTMAAAIEAEPRQISVKATTTEHLGFVGREEGVLASAVVLLSRAA